MGTCTWATSLVYRQHSKTKVGLCRGVRGIRCSRLCAAVHANSQSQPEGGGPAGPACKPALAFATRSSSMCSMQLFLTTPPAWESSLQWHLALRESRLQCWHFTGSSLHGVKAKLLVSTILWAFATQEVEASTRLRISFMHAICYAMAMYFIRQWLAARWTMLLRHTSAICQLRELQHMMLTGAAAC